MRPWKFGSIAHASPYFSYDEFLAKDKKAKYQYILDLIHHGTMAASEEFDWDKNIFENAYNAVMKCDFVFRREYPVKQSRDRKKTGRLIVEKTDKVTSVFVQIETNSAAITKKLFDKGNQWWYDCIYYLAKHCKWLDNDRFGISINKNMIESWYSLSTDTVVTLEEGDPVENIRFGKYFRFESPK